MSTYYMQILAFSVTQKGKPQIEVSEKMGKGNSKGSLEVKYGEKRKNTDRIPTLIQPLVPTDVAHELSSCY